MSIKKILITGGAGFIGSALVRYLLNNSDHVVKNIDKLTYAGNLDSLKSISSSPNYSFHRTDICDESSIKKIFEDFKRKLLNPDISTTQLGKSVQSFRENVSQEDYDYFLDLVAII